MSNYFKRVIVIKEIKSGYSNGSQSPSAILKAESVPQHGVRLDLTLLNLENNDRLKLVLYSSNLLILNCEKEQFAAIDLSSGLSASIFKDDELLCFGSGGSGAPTRAELLNKYNEKIKLSHPSAKNIITEGIYDDERISDVNYYDNLAIGGHLYAKQEFFNTNDESEKFDKKQAETEERCKSAYYDASNSNSCEKPQSIFSPYFETVREQLKNVFSRGTKESGLEKVIPDSKWVRINYSVDKYYVVGIVEKNNSPYYICYGVPSSYKNPPETFKGYASYIPSSLFNLTADGYYVMFQSALSGECITPKIDVFGL